MAEPGQDQDAQELQAPLPAGSKPYIDDVLGPQPADRAGDTQSPEGAGAWLSVLQHTYEQSIPTAETPPMPSVSREGTIGSALDAINPFRTGLHAPWSASPLPKDYVAGQEPVKQYGGPLGVGQAEMRMLATPEGPASMALGPGSVAGTLAGSAGSEVARQAGWGVPGQLAAGVVTGGIVGGLSDWALLKHAESMFTTGAIASRYANRAGIVLPETGRTVDTQMAAGQQLMRDYATTATPPSSTFARSIRDAGRNGTALDAYNTATADITNFGTYTGPQQQAALARLRSLPPNSQNAIRASIIDGIGRDPNGWQAMHPSLQQWVSPDATETAQLARRAEAARIANATAAAAPPGSPAAAPMRQLVDRISRFLNTQLGSRTVGGLLGGAAGLSATSILPGGEILSPFLEGGGALVGSMGARVGQDLGVARTIKNFLSGGVGAEATERQERHIEATRPHKVGNQLNMAPPD